MTEERAEKESFSSNSLHVRHVNHILITLLSQLIPISTNALIINCCNYKNRVILEVKLARDIIAPSFHIPK